MIPFLNRWLGKRPAPPPALPGEGIRFTETLDLPYKIVYIRDKPVPTQHTFNELVIRESSGKEVRWDLTPEVLKHGNRDGWANPCPQGPLIWSGDGTTLYFSRQQLESLDTASGETRQIPLPSPDKYRYWLLGRTNTGDFIVSRYELKEWGNLPIPLPAYSTETIYRVNAATNEFQLLSPVHVEQFLSNQMYYPTASRLVYSWSRQETDQDIRSRGLVIVDTNNGETQQIPQPEMGMGDVTLSSVQASLVAEGKEGLYRIQPGHETWEHFLSYGQRPVYAPDGSRIAFMDGGGCLCILPAEGKPEDVRVLAYCEGQYNPKTKDDWQYTQTSPVWSPDGRFLWFNLRFTGRTRTLCNFLGRLMSESTTKTLSEDGHQWRNSFSNIIDNAWNSAGMYHHDRVGVVDLEEGTVWIAEGEWKALSWCPVKG